VRVEASIPGGASPRSRAGIDEKAGLVELVGELVNAGLVDAEVGEDGVTWYTLTPAGQRTARQMAMHRDAHARVLLGALMGSGEFTN
jgi:hypothetical protein